ncbi:MAG: hypothetical protein AAGC95_01360 [Pseudomonadota bacterium]
MDPQDKHGWSEVQDFAAVPTHDAEKYFTCFTDARKFAKNVQTLPQDPKAAVAAAQLHRSKASAQPEQNEAAQDVAKTSAQARMRQAAISPEGQKRFFEDYAAHNGYPSSQTHIDDDMLLDSWRQFRSGALKENDFIAPLMSVPKEQRVSVALNLARLVARDQFKNSREFENETLNDLADEIDKAKRAFGKSVPGSTEEKSITAKLNNLSVAYDAEMSTLTDAGVAAGSEALEKLLGLPPENAPKRPSARLSWSPCQDWNEVDKVISVFRGACKAYNAQTEFRQEDLLVQNGVMKDSALPMLGMPLALRGDALAKNVHRQAQQNFLESHGFAEPQSRAEQAWRAVKAVGAALGYVFGLGWIIPSVRDALLPAFSQKERTRLANAHADKTLLTFLQSQNRRLAEEWVKEQYSKPALGASDDIHNDATDPHGLFAAILNPRDQELSNDFIAREKLIEDVKGQLYLAAKNDIRAEKEKRAATLNVPISDQSVIIDNEDYLTEASYLQKIAESIVDGIAAGLQWSAQQRQLPSSH